MNRLLAAVLAALMAVGGVTGCTGPLAPVATTPAPSESAEPTPSVTLPTVTLEQVQTTVFSDQESDHPDHGAAAYVACLGLMPGTPEGAWSPDLPADYACAAVALCRLSGAAEEGLGEAHDPITRGELAVLLYNYANAQGLDTAAPEGHLDNYWDGRQVPEEQRQAVSWCLYSGLFAPITAREVHPGYVVTRAQLAQVLTALQAPFDPVAKTLYDQRLTTLESKSQAAHDKLQQDIEAIAKQYGAAGVQVAVIEGGRVTDAFVYGRARRGQEGAAMTPDHKIRVASLSKVVVAMTTLALVEDGKLDLDASIGPYWNCEAKNNAYPDTPVTIRSILSHTSSIPIYDGLTADSYNTVRQRLANGKFASLKPGDLRAWGYNNYAFNVLGMTLELSQDRYYDHIAGEYLFDPLGIEAGIIPGELAHTELLCDIFTSGGGVGRSVQEQLDLRHDRAVGDRGIHFAGGLTISAVDYAKLLSALAGDGVYEGQRLLSSQSVALMETPLGTPSGQVFEQCYPLRHQRNIYGRDELYYHTGSNFGVYNLASYDPVTGDGVVVLTTGAGATKDSHGIYAVCGRITQSVYTALSQG